MRAMFRAAAAASVLAVVATGAAGCAKPAKSTGASTTSFKACMVTDTGGINDKSFNQSAWEGVKAAGASDSKISTTYLPSTSSADYATNITTFIHDKCGIIITVGFLMGPATEAAAKANPKQDFAIVDCSYASDCLPAPQEKNIDQLVYDTVEDGALGGYLAAGMSKTHVVATYGGEDFGTVTIYEDGFWDGVQYYDIYHHITTKVLGWNEKTQKGSFIGSFTDLGAAQTLTNTFIGDNADIIFPVAGDDGLGTAAAVKAANAAGKDVDMFWVDTDGCISAAQYCPYFITSVTKGITNSVQNAVLEAAHGKFHGGTYIGTLANGGAVLAPYHDWASKIPASLQAEVNALKAEIESGKVNPPTKSPV
jgi:basic membrane protein A and related proteins